MQPGAAGGFQKLFFGREEVAVPQFGSTADACEAYPRADVFINFASYRSAFESSMEALKQPTIRVVAIIAEASFWLLYMPPSCSHAPPRPAPH